MARRTKDNESPADDQAKASNATALGAEPTPVEAASAPATEPVCKLMMLFHMSLASLDKNVISAFACKPNLATFIFQIKCLKFRFLIRVDNLLAT